MRRLWLNYITQHPLLMTIGFILLVIIGAVGGKNLQFNGDYKVYFEQDNPQRLAFEAMQNVFNKNEAANILIRNQQGNIFNPTTLKLIAELTEQAWQTPLSIRVDSVSNFQHTWSEVDEMIVEELVSDPENISEDQLQRIQQISLSEPNLRNRFVSESGEVALISVTVNLPEGDKSKATADVTSFLFELTSEMKQKYPDHDFYHTGVIFMNHAFEAEAKKDAGTLVPLMFLIIILVLWILLRSFFATLSTLIIVIASIASTMGIAGWLGLYLTTATVNVPTLVMTLAVADCVHVIASMLHEMRKGASKQVAILTSMEMNLQPIFVTTVTTAIGFLTLNFSNVPALAELGSLTAVGVILAFLFSVTLLPSLLMLLPIKVTAPEQPKDDKIIRLGEWVIAHHKRIIPVTIVISVLAVAAATMNKVNDIPVEYFDDSNRFKVAADFQSDTLGGMTTIDFALDTGIESGINQPEVLQNIQDFSNWLREQPEVDHVTTITDVYKRLNKNMHSDDPAYYRLPDNQELAAQFLLLYEMSLPFNLDLNNQLNLDKSATRISVVMQNLGSEQLTGFESRAHNWIESNASGLTLTAGSQNLMFAHIGEANMESMLRGTVLALVLISFILIFALKSLRMGLISLLPNLLPAAIGFGFWGLISGEINMGLSVVLSMALGIIVDDTVHFLSKYQLSRRKGSDAVTAVRYAFSSVGRALLITTVVLALGFAVLTLSTFALNSDMGLLVGVIIVVALVVDFLFLPAFLLLFDKKDSSKEMTDEDQHTSGTRR